MLTQCDEPYELNNTIFKEKFGSLYKSFFESVDYQKAERIYFGSEFCQHLLPDLEDVKAVIEYAKMHEMKFSLVTSCVFNDGINKVIPILEYLNGIEEEIEVICNDWGIVQLIYNRFYNLKIILGRLMDKMPREPRITYKQFKTIYGDDGMRFLQTPNIYVGDYQEILNIYNINRVEIDCVPQGLNVEEKLYNGFELKMSLYFPFYYVTSGAMCMFKFLTRAEDDKYNISGNCAKICKHYERIMKKNMYIEEKNREVLLYNKGNTIYGQIEDISKYIRLKSLVDRYILQFF